MQSILYLILKMRNKEYETERKLIMHFFKMPNSIFDYKLSSKSIFVYAYLLSRMNALRAITISYKTIAENCHMDNKTAISAVNELESRRLISKETRHDYRGKLKNKYILNKLSGGWFKAEYCIFSTQIKSTDFMVYCYIKMRMNCKSNESFPSLNTITNGTGLSHSRVVTAVKYLRQFTFINSVHRHYKKTKAYRHNRYLLYKLTNKKRKTRLPVRVFLCLKRFSKHFSSLKEIIVYINQKVNGSFKNRGSPYFPYLL